MRKILFAAVALTAAVAMYSCVQMTTIRGNGVTAEKVVAFGQTYRELSVSGGITVILSPTLTDRAEIVADEIAMEYISVTESGGRVKVSYSPHVNVKSKIQTIVTLPVSPMISALKVSSAATLHADNLILSKENIHVDCSSSGTIRARLESPNVSVGASSAAKCELDIHCGRCSISASSSAKYSGRVTARELSADLSSAASCTVEGKCDKLRVNASSSASFNGGNLESGDVFVEGSSAAKAEVWAVEKLGVNISSAARVNYKGEPEITSRNISSGASMNN